MRVSCGGTHPATTNNHTKTKRPLRSQVREPRAVPPNRLFPFQMQLRFWMVWNDLHKQSSTANPPANSQKNAAANTKPMRAQLQWPRKVLCIRLIVLVCLLQSVLRKCLPVETSPTNPTATNPTATTNQTTESMRTQLQRAWARHRCRKPVRLQLCHRLAREALREGHCNNQSDNHKASKHQTSLRARTIHFRTFLVR